MKQFQTESKATRSDGSGTSLGTVIKLFLFWKLILLAIACASPGPGYDTSTQILLDQYSVPSTSWFASAIEHAVLRLTRWDGIYFSSLATRGHVNEQDWAFSWVLARVTSFVARVFLSPLPLSAIVKHALIGILISHVSHLLAVAVLYELTFQIMPASVPTKRSTAFIAACLHTISPAGLFLSAPYGESTFAFFNFMGMVTYVHAVQTKLLTSPSPATETYWRVAAGIWFGAAATIRSNGLLSGIILACDALEAVARPSQLLQDSKIMVRFAATMFSGALVAVGFAAPQVVAYVEYCTSGNTRPWCSRMPPSIYSWVQEYYWEVGFLKYWTLSNLPLFLLAAPMLGIMLYTGYVALWQTEVLASICTAKQDPQPSEVGIMVFKHALARFAVPQLVLTVMAATSFHVQIVNRISSGYPVWYIVLAIALYATSADEVKKASIKERKDKIGTPRRDLRKTGSKRDASLLLRYLKASRLQWIVRVMVMYAVVQGGLYASFLPPA